MGIGSFFNGLIAGSAIYQLGQNPDPYYGGGKEDVQDEVRRLKYELLSKLKRDIGISETVYEIDAELHIDEKGDEFIYFYTSGEPESDDYWQECCGKIGKGGDTTAYKIYFKAWDSKKNGFKDKEDLSRYSDEERKVFEDYKEIIKTELEAREKEDDEWYASGVFHKLIAKISGNKLKTYKKTKNFLTNLPEELKEQSDPVSIRETLQDMVNEYPENESEITTELINREKTDIEER